MPVDILLGLILGLAGPMVVDRMAGRHKWPALLLLGKTVKARAGTAQI
jgi:hypothetical protein